MDINSLLDSRASASPPRKRSGASSESTAASLPRTSGLPASGYPQPFEYATPTSLPAISPNVGPLNQHVHPLQPAPAAQYLPPMKQEAAEFQQTSGYRPLYAAQPPPHHAYAPPPSGMVSPPLPYSSIKRAASQTPLGEEPTQKKTTKWTQEEDEMTVELRGAGMKWEDISKRIPGRSAISCRLRYQNYLEKRAHWDEEKKNKLARLYVRFKEQMWQRIASEMGVPWRSAEAMHWQLGPDEIAQRANQPVFQLSASATTTSPTSERPPLPPAGPGYGPVPPIPGPPPGPYSTMSAPTSPPYSGVPQPLEPGGFGPGPAMAGHIRRESDGGPGRRRADSGGHAPLIGAGFVPPMPPQAAALQHTLPMSDPSNRLYPISNAYSNALPRSDVEDTRSRSSLEGAIGATTREGMTHRSASRSGEEDRRSRASRGSPKSVTSEKSVHSGRSGKSRTGPNDDREQSKERGSRGGNISEQRLAPA